MSFETSLKLALDNIFKKIPDDMQWKTINNRPILVSKGDLNEYSEFADMENAEIDKRLDGCNSEVINNCSEDIKESFRRYKEDFDESKSNGGLSERDITNIQTAIEKSELKEDLYVISMCKNEVIEQIKESNGTWKPDELISSTLGKGNTEFGINKLSISISKGKGRGLYLDNAGFRINTEKEFLLNKNTEYKVKEIRDYRFGQEVILEVK